LGAPPWFVELDGVLDLFFFGVYEVRLIEGSLLLKIVLTSREWLSVSVFDVPESQRFLFSLMISGIVSKF